MKNKKIACITGSQGLIGSAAVQRFLDQGYSVVGIDNDMRKFFFGAEGSTELSSPLSKKSDNFTFYSVDIRNKSELEKIFSKHSFSLIIHCAAQPSHDRAKDFPLVDFEVNVLGTLNLLEYTRLYCPDATFIFTSTNKVYGDNPNTLELIEKETRFDYANSDYKGIDETLSVDQCLHSLFGASKLAADTYVQEYGKYFGLSTATLRLGCVTGKSHASVKLHGFLSYLIKTAVREKEYQIIGYHGKQVRDQIHAEDVALAMVEISKNPPKGEVYNLGGGRKNSTSIMEIIDILEHQYSISLKTQYVSTPRVGDHICYITDTTKFQTAFPEWKITHELADIIEEIITYEQQNED